jgi:hypothetical protein
VSHRLPADTLTPVSTTFSGLKRACAAESEVTFET